MQVGGSSGRARGAQSAVEVSEEYPAWVRECDQDFKDKSCTLTHEGRTLQKWRAFVGRLESSSANPFRKAARFRCSACETAARKKGRSKKLNHNYGAPPLMVLVETEGCTCHMEIHSMLPHLDTTYVPDELLAPSGQLAATGKRKKAAPSRSTASRATRVKLEPGLDESEAAENIFGESYGADDENPQGGEAEEGDGGGEKEGKEEGEVRKSGEDGDEDDEPEVEEDLENDDYAAGQHCDDDEDLVDEGGGGSDDEEARYGTY